MSESAESFALRRVPQTRASSETRPFGLRLDAFVRPRSVHGVPLRTRSFVADLDLSVLQPRLDDLPHADFETRGDEGIVASPTRDAPSAPAAPRAELEIAPATSVIPRVVNVPADIEPHATARVPTPREAQAPADSRIVRDLPDEASAARLPAPQRTLAQMHSYLEVGAPPSLSSSIAAVAPNFQGERMGPASDAPLRQDPPERETARTQVGTSPVQPSVPRDQPDRAITEPRRDPAQAPQVAPPAERAPAIAPMGLTLSPPEDSGPRTAGMTANAVERLVQLQEHVPSRETVRIGTVQVVVRARSERAPAPAPAAPPPPTKVAAPRSSHRNVWLSRRRQE